MASTLDSSSDRTSELKAFDETKAGVKGLVDAGITKVPWIFHHPPDDLDKTLIVPTDGKFRFPIIDLEGVRKDPFQRNEIVERVRDASETWGFFEVVNHGIPVSVLEEMKDGVRRFYEQDVELKKEYFSRDIQERDILMEYSKAVMNLGNLLLELLSEALGLNPNYLKDIDCAKGLAVLCHYYPACPQPELTLGATKHSDNDFLTVLLQDQIGGLQILHQNQWVDVLPTPGALVINIGDLMQLISNDKFISVEHRVLANCKGPRVSVACFFSTFLTPSPRFYGPMKELLSEENLPKYRETTVRDYCAHYNEKGLGRTSALLDFKL